MILTASVRQSRWHELCSYFTPNLLHVKRQHKQFWKWCPAVRNHTLIWPVETHCLAFKTCLSVDTRNTQLIPSWNDSNMNLWLLKRGCEGTETQSCNHCSLKSQSGIHLPFHTQSSWIHIHLLLWLCFCLWQMLHWRMSNMFHWVVCGASTRLVSLSHRVCGIPTKPTFVLPLS